MTFAFGVGSGEVWAGVGGTANYTQRPIRVVSGPMRHKNLAEALTAPIVHERMDAFGLTVMLVNIVMAIIGVVVAVASLVTAIVGAMIAVMVAGAAGGPVGEAIAAVVVALLALALALQAGFSALAERVRDDNTTTLVVVNRFRGASVFGKVPDLRLGDPIGAYEQDLDSWGAGPIGFRALGQAFSNPNEDHALVFAVRGRVEGTVTLVVNNKGKRTEIDVKLDNPLGPDQARSNHSVQVADTSVAKATGKLFKAEGDSHRDVYVVVVEEPDTSPAELAAAPDRAVSDASLPVPERRMGLRVVNGDQRGEFLIDLTDLDPTGGGGTASGFSRRKQFAESTLKSVKKSVGSQLSDKTLTDMDKAVTAFGSYVDYAGAVSAGIDLVPDVWVVGKAAAESIKMTASELAGIPAAVSGAISKVLNIAGIVAAAASVSYSIISMTQDANSTAVIIVNMVKGSKVRVTTVFFTQGGVTDDTPYAELKSKTAECTDRISDVLVLRMGPRAAGRITGEVTLPNGSKKEFSIDFSNPIGPDQSRSDWEVSPSRSGKVSFSGALQPPQDEKGNANRRDVFVLAIEPAQELQMTGSIGMRPMAEGTRLRIIDAICAFPKERRFMFFQGSKYIAVPGDTKKNEDPKTYPAPIWTSDAGTAGHKVPNDLDAAVTWNDNRVYCFKGNQYWAYDIGSRRTTSDDFPKPLSTGWGPDFFDRVDAAINWGDGFAYLFRGNQVIKWPTTKGSDGKKVPGYPKTIAEEFGADFPYQDRIDAAVAWSDGHAFFFRGTTYHKVRLSDRGALPDYPRPVTTAEGHCWWGDHFFEPGTVEIK